MTRLIESVVSAVVLAALAWSLPRWFAWRESLWRTG